MSELVQKKNSWGWLIPLALIVAAVVVYAYYQNKNHTYEQTYSSPNTTTNSSVNNIDQLSSVTAGTKAELSSITINQVVAGSVFTITSGNQTIYAVLNPNIDLPAKTTLQAGQQVAITGTLVSTNSDQFKNLNLTTAEKSALAHQSLVLLVDQVTIAGPNATTNPNTKN